MVILLQYVEEKGYIIKRFIGIDHVTTLSLKETIDALFSKHGRSISKLLGQGYDGVTNLKRGV